MGVQKIMWFTGWGIINLDTLFQVNVTILIIGDKSCTLSRSLGAGG